MKDKKEIAMIPNRYEVCFEDDLVLMVIYAKNSYEARKIFNKQILIKQDV